MFTSCRYESTSSDDSSSESSDEGSDSSEYHEAREKLPESLVQHQQLTYNKLSQPPDSNSVPQQTAVQPPALIPDSQPSRNLSATVDTKLPDKPSRSPATDSILQNCASSTLIPSCPSNDPASEEAVNQQIEKHSQEITSTSASTESTSEQSIKSSLSCSSSLCVTKTTEITQQQYTVQSETSVLSGQSELQPAAENIAKDTATVSAKHVR